MSKDVSKKNDDSTTKNDKKPDTKKPDAKKTDTKKKTEIKKKDETKNNDESKNEEKKEEQQNESKEGELQETLGLIKPDAFYRASEIIPLILKAGFTILDIRQVKLTKTLAEEFYGEHKGRSFFEELVTFMSSGPIYALKLQKKNAIKDWRKLIGPTKREDAVKDKNCLRATFGTNTTKNACHGSDAVKTAQRELDFYFNYQKTLALVKPTAFKSGNAPKIVARIEKEGFVISERQEIQLTKERAGAFYAEHKGKGFYDELVTFMSSGKILALKLERKDAIKKWREVMGPTKRQDALKKDPNCMRALYGKNTTENATHGSDSIESAARELEFYFPVEQTFAILKPDALKNKYENKIIQRIVKEQFRIIDSKKLQLTKELAGGFYAEHKERSFFGELVTYMTSGPVITLKLERTNAVKKWRDVMGPTFTDKAKKEAPKSIRALYGNSKTENATHGSDAIKSAKRELEYFFKNGGNLQRTLALIKPDAVKAGNENNIINIIKYNGFTIIEQKKLKLTKEKAEQFYAEHKGRSFFKELITFITSGDLIALKLERINAIKKWRQLMGPTKREDALKTDPNCMRSLYGKNTTQNATHGSDSIQSAKKELTFYFG